MCPEMEWEEQSHDLLTVSASFFLHLLNVSQLRKTLTVKYPLPWWSVSASWRAWPGGWWVVPWGKVVVVPGPGLGASCWWGELGHACVWGLELDHFRWSGVGHSPGVGLPIRWLPLLWAAWSPVAHPPSLVLQCLPWVAGCTFASFGLTTLRLVTQ